MACRPRTGRASGRYHPVAIQYRRIGWTQFPETGKETHSTTCDCKACLEQDDWCRRQVLNPARLDGALDAPQEDADEFAVALARGEVFSLPVDAVSMDGAQPSEVLPGARGWYRHYSATGWTEPVAPTTIELVGDEQDRWQIAYEVARECPVTGSVVFSMRGGKLVATLVSYVAFA